MKTVGLAPFGIALREAIDESPFKNRSAFLAAAGTQPPVLYRYETGEQSPRLDQVAEWASLLGCAPERLIPFIKRDEVGLPDPDLRDFLASELGRQTTPEERDTLTLVATRHGRARSHETYRSLLALIRAGFIESTPVPYSYAREPAEESKRVPPSGDQIRPRVRKKGESTP
jgi:hypothetical protein